MTVDIPGYKIVKTLGKGGMATVYLAVQEIFEREVALKVMSKSLADDPSFGQRFLREARIVSQLVHPNIVTVYDVGVHDGAYYLSMEYVEGKDLRHMRKRIGFRDKISIIMDMGKALDYAGKKGYVHRDIKPENIMVYAKERRAILMDFGIARAAEVDISVTQAGTAIGTPHYMSPEQAKGRAVDTRADIYGLGVVFYYLLIGQVPYEGDSAVAIGIKHITEAIPLLPRHLEPLQFILDGMMAKDPDDRFQTGAELVAALDIIAIEELEQAELDVLAARKSSDEPEITPTLISIQSDLMSKGATGGITEINDPDRYTLAFDSFSSTVERGRWIWPAVMLLIAAVVGLGGYFITQVDPESAADNLQNDIVAQQSLAELIRGANNSTEQLSKLPPAIKAKRQAKMEEKLEALRVRYKSNKAVLEEFVETHRQLIAMLPEEKKYQQSYLQLAEGLLREVGPLFSAGRFKEAQQRFNRVQVVFPEYDSIALPRLRARIANKAVIEKKLALANKLYKLERLVDPAKDNAVNVYNEILAIDPAIYPAKLGLKNIAARFVGKAEANVQSNDIDSALANIDTALALDPVNAVAMALKFKLAADQPVGEYIKSLFAQADRQIFHHEFYAPRGQSAFDSYSQILVLDENNRQARKGLDLLLNQAQDHALEFVQAGKFADAQALLNTALERRDGDGKVQLALLKLDEAILSAQRDMTPYINAIRASSEHQIKLSDSQPLGISAKKTIYFKFAYNNFPEGKVLMKAHLYGESRRKELTQIQVVVAGREGESSFAINNPKANFANGNYILDLKVNKKILSTLSFTIRSQ